MTVAENKVEEVDESEEGCMNVKLEVAHVNDVQWAQDEESEVVYKQDEKDGTKDNSLGYATGSSEPKIILSVLKIGSLVSATKVRIDLTDSNVQET